MSALADTPPFFKRQKNKTDNKTAICERGAAKKTRASIRVDIFCRTKRHACRSVLSQANAVHRTIEAATVLRMNNMPVIAFVYVNEVNHLKLPRVVGLHKLLDSLKWNKPLCTSTYWLVLHRKSTSLPMHFFTLPDSIVLPSFQACAICQLFLHCQAPGRPHSSISPFLSALKFQPFPRRRQLHSNDIRKSFDRMS